MAFKYRISDCLAANVEILEGNDCDNSDQNFLRLR